MSSQLDRRTFMGAAAASGAALSLMNSADAAAVQGANERLRVGVIGTGGRGTGLASAFQTLGSQANVDVTYVCDVDQARADRAAAAVAKISGKAAPRAVQNLQ